MWVKRPEHETNYSHPPSAAVKNMWSHTSSPLIMCIATTLTFIQSYIFALISQGGDRIAVHARPRMPFYAA
jgi:hypothetical protein